MVKDLGNGKTSKAIIFTSQLFASTVEIPSKLSNSYAIYKSKEILKGAILELKEKPYEYNFKNMEIKLFAKDEDKSKQHIIEYTTYVIIALAVIKGIIVYVLYKIYYKKN